MYKDSLSSFVSRKIKRRLDDERWFSKTINKLLRLSVVFGLGYFLGSRNKSAKPSKVTDLVDHFAEKVNKVMQKEND